MRDLLLQLRVEAYSSKNKRLIEIADQLARRVARLERDNASYKQRWIFAVQRLLTFIVHPPNRG